MAEEHLKPITICNEDVLQDNVKLTQQLATMREALDWSGLKISNTLLVEALKELGPPGTRAEAYVSAAVCYAMHMRTKAEQVLKEKRLEGVDDSTR